MKQLYGTKLGMTELFSTEEKFTVTKVRLHTATISQKKSADTDGYSATQVTFGAPLPHPSKALKGHFKKITPLRHTRELKSTLDDKEIGDSITPSEFIAIGDIVSVQGTSKGKGFTGTIKRWNFARQPRTHGQSDRERAPGSIGQGTDPGRVHKGKKMAGRHGGLTTTVKSSQIIHFDDSDQIAFLTGHVPGNNGSLVRLTITGHKDAPRLSISVDEPEVVDATDTNVEEAPTSDLSETPTGSITPTTPDEQAVKPEDSQESESTSESPTETEQDDQSQREEESK